MSAPDHALHLDFVQRFLRLWDHLTKPSPAIQDFAEQRQVRLLSSLLVTLISIATLFVIRIAIVNYSGMVYVYLALIGVVFALYRLSRTERHKLAAQLMVAVLTIAIFGIVFPLSTVDSVAILNYLLVGVLFSSILLSARTTAILIILDLLVILLAARIRPEAGSYTNNQWCKHFLG
jgi:hypothetical protein